MRAKKVEGGPIEVVVKDYPEKNAEHSYPFMRVLDKKGHRLCDLWTMDMVKRSAKISNWRIIEVVHVPPTEKVKEEPNEENN